jgi:NAD(P)-dependent dehydrogenase (short-subunit alcohol dehydrogenase family)
MTRARIGWLAGTTALVTGASGRLGRAVANADAREGDLLLDGRRPEPLERVREEVEALGARAVASAPDVGDAAATMWRLDIEG